jgi:hypothetical protein
MREAGASSAAEAARLADLFCRTTRRQTRSRFHALWFNDDAARYEAGLAVMSGSHTWLESGIVGLRRSTESLVPETPARGGEHSETRPIAGVLARREALEEADEERAAGEGMTLEKRGWKRRDTG